MDVLSTLLAAACHDFKHNGYNNTYHINDLSEYAIKYNGKHKPKNYTHLNH